MSIKEDSIKTVTNHDIAEILTPKVIEQTPEEKAEIEAKVKDAEAAAAKESQDEKDAELLTDEEKALAPEEQEKVKKTRISKQKRELLELQKEKEALQKKTEELEGRVKELTPAPPERKPEPELKDFATAAEYSAALKEWAKEDAMIQAQIQIENERKVTSFKSLQSAFMAKNPDYAEVLQASTVKVPNDIRDAIIDSDFAPDILYHLAKNPNDARALNGKYGMKELGAIERMIRSEARKVEKEESKPEIKSVPGLKIVNETKKAPAPISPIRGSSADLTGALTADGKFVGTPEEYRKLRKEGKIK